MEGKALAYFQDMDESSQLRDWDQFMKALLSTFGPSCDDNPMEALTLFRQIGFEKDYKTQLISSFVF